MREELITITDPRIEEYLMEVQGWPHPVMKEMDDLARKKDFPHIGPVVGRFLKWLGGLYSFKRVFEMGSGFGYSASWLASGMAVSGEIHLSDRSGENLALAKGFFSRMEGFFKHRFCYHQGDAIKLLREVQGDFDLILLDIDKKEYPLALPVIERKLRIKGILVADNVLWGGAVVEGREDEETWALLEFTRNLLSSPTWDAAILPIRDGILVATRL